MGIVCLYGPTDDTPEFFGNLFCLLQNLQCKDLIVGGDFNLVLNDELDKTGGRSRHENAAAQRVVNNLMEEFGLRDIYRIIYPGTKKFSHNTNGTYKN